MPRSLLERKLTEVAERLKELRQDLVVTEEQLIHFEEQADEARLRALVSETALGFREHNAARKHADAMARHRDGVRAAIKELEARQDELLDRLMAEKR